MIDKEKLAVGLDAGSFRTRCVICSLETPVVGLSDMGSIEVPIGTIN